MDDEHLIEMVHRHPVLFDLSHSKYMDTGYKMNIWSKIGKELKTDGPTCKVRWSNIRDNYRKSRKKIATKSGQTGKQIKPYKYSDQLSFLNKFFTERETKGNIEPREAELEVGRQDDELDHVQAMKESAVNSPDPQDFRSDDCCTSDTNAQTLQKTFKKRKQIPQESASSTLIKYILSKNTSQKSTPTTHPVDAFLSGISPTLKTLNPYLLNLAKSEIFAIVQKYEMKMLTQQPTQEAYRILPELMLNTFSYASSSSSPSSNDREFTLIPTSVEEDVKREHLSPSTKSFENHVIQD
ncbi:uncharacterized protein [Centruroides vittatus]|uniref:uncharacterized protein n=1 Tax=Centruroides vittatus TaxID=120091 RepID=UPI00351027FF